MCDISKKTKLKEKTVYKLVIKNGGEYYSCFAGKKLRVGKVNPLTTDEAAFMATRFDIVWARYYLPGKRNDDVYNKNMVGAVSGFQGKRYIKTMMKDPAMFYMKSLNATVLKIKLGGNIMKGTAKNIPGNIPHNAVTYAGTEILSMEEVAL